MPTLLTDAALLQQRQALLTLPEHVRSNRPFPDALPASVSPPHNGPASRPSVGREIGTWVAVHAVAGLAVFGLFVGLASAFPFPRS